MGYFSAVGVVNLSFTFAFCLRKYSAYFCEQPFCNLILRIFRKFFHFLDGLGKKGCHSFEKESETLRQNSHTDPTVNRETNSVRAPLLVLIENLFGYCQELPL
jgi:hypothetical protein